MDLTIINMLPPANYVHFLKVHRNCTYYSFYSSSLNWESKGSARAVTATESTSWLYEAEHPWLYRAPNKLKPIEDSFDFQT